MQSARVAEIRRPAYYYQRKARLTISVTDRLYHFSDGFSLERVSNWRLFSPKSLKNRNLDAARLVAVNEITKSLRRTDTLADLLEKVADGFNDIFPCANLELEFRADLLKKAPSGSISQNFPYLHQNGWSKLFSGITRATTSIKDVHQKMLGLPLFDNKDSLLGMMVLSLTEGISRFPVGFEPFAEQLGSYASLAIQYRKEIIIDPLTGLGNRGYFDDRINQEWERSLRYPKPLSFLLLDIDHFKTCNDTHGHPFGDKVLQEFAEILKDETRTAIDLPMRYGGEEFAVILPETSYEGAYKLAERIRKKVAEHKFLTEKGEVVPVTVSVGVASSEQEMNKDELIKIADQNLYAAKNSGRNKVV